MSRFAVFARHRRKLSCAQVGEVMQAYLDREVDDLTARRVARHLEQCRRCGMELSVYTEIKASLGRGAGALDPTAVDRLRAFSRHLAAGAHDQPESDEGSHGA